MFIYHLPPACSTDDLADSCLQFTPSSKIRVPCHRWLALQHKECFGWLSNEHRKSKAKQSIDLSSAGAEHWEDKWAQCNADFSNALWVLQGSGDRGAAWQGCAETVYSKLDLGKAHRLSQFIAARPGARTTPRPPQGTQWCYRTPL